MTKIFDRDLNTKVFPEVSELTSQDPHRQLSLNPLPSVKATLDKEKATLIVLKPLVESQNILHLLNYFEGSKAVWIYRDFKDVAASHVKKWGSINSINDLRAIVDALPNNWRFENVSEDVRNFVLDHYSEQMDPYDAAAVYWIVRNRLFFELNLAENPNILIYKYEQIVADPSSGMQKVYQFLGHKYPGDQIVRNVHRKSVNKGRDIHLSIEIDRQCTKLMRNLDQLASADIQRSDNIVRISEERIRVT